MNRDLTPSVPHRLLPDIAELGGRLVRASVDPRKGLEVEGPFSLVPGCGKAFVCVRLHQLIVG